MTLLGANRALQLALVTAAAAQLVTARADDRAFGEAGQKVVFGEAGFTFAVGGPFHDRPQIGLAVQPDSKTRLNVAADLQPGALYFFARNLALGVAIGAAYESNQMSAPAYKQLDIGVSVGFGVNVPLSRRVSFFPHVWAGPGYLYRKYDWVSIPSSTAAMPAFGAVSASAVDGPFLGAQLLLPLQFSLGAAAFLAVGPGARLQLPFGDGLASVRLSLTAGFGSYF